jgi:hypothetical protein
MGVILSDFHDDFQTATGRVTRDGISDAVSRGQVCPNCRRLGERSGQRNLWSANRRTGFGGCKSNACTTFLEVKLQSKLELSRVKRCSWPAVVSAIARALAKGVDIVDKPGRGALVEAIKQIEALCDDI